ncbi:MAG: hypothetical protein IPO24_18415 [Bacteroidetes bacterium]|nr:hypothetical protein [Bacteroidota bacterium]
MGNGVDPFSPFTNMAQMPLVGMITNAQPWDNLKFDNEGIVEDTRKFLVAYIIPIHFCVVCEY